MEPKVESTRNTISESMGTEKWIPLTAARHQMLLQPNTGLELNMTEKANWPMTHRDPLKQREEQTMTSCNRLQVESTKSWAWTKSL